MKTKQEVFGLLLKDLAFTNMMENQSNYSNKNGLDILAVQSIYEDKEGKL